jgi:hypothetical protein
MVENWREKNKHKGISRRPSFQIILPERQSSKTNQGNNQIL